MFRKCIRGRKFFKIYAVFVVLLVIIYIKYFYIAPEDDDSKVDKYEREIRDYESKIIAGLGSEGKASFLDGEDKIMGELQLKSIALNTVLSNKIPLDRNLLDPRIEECKSLRYNVHKKTSVVIIFHEEPFSVLLRTVWSVINRTPHNLLHEIILVDDFSRTNIALGKRLDHYINTRLKIFPIKLLRTKSRHGLIRARLAGARAATGDVLVFLDAHCETTIQWLEPLLDRIEFDRTIVAIPIIDVIEADTLKYSTNGNTFQIGGFSWAGHFTWIDIQKSEKDRRKRVTDPVRSPTMAGGLFAIDRSYFWESGSYDEQMDGWGGENLELSFRIWQCGGKLEQVPCSRIGHIFRDFHPYKLPFDKNTHAINTARLASVWMDEYADLYFLHSELYKNNPSIGDLTHRKQLRKKLRCKPFSWYLENIYPEKFVLTKNVKAFGQVQTHNNLCCDNMQLEDEKVGPLSTYQCHVNAGTSQLFSLTNAGEFRQEEHCAEVTARNTVQLAKCHGHGGTQQWVYENGFLKNPQSGLCLSADVLQSEPLAMKNCDKKSEFQIWTFKSRK